MPIRHTDKGWYWGSKGAFATKAQALQVMRSAYANGYKDEEMDDALDNEYTVEECVMYLLHAVTNAHILHLQTQSYAEHKALETLYTEIGDLVDSFVEAYQGKYGLIMNYPAEYELPPAPLQYVIGLSDYLKQARPSLPQDTELQNILDEIASLLDSTVYKLRFLK